MVNPAIVSNPTSTNPMLTAQKLILSGKVQGVGFRPFIYTLATKLQLNGWVKNCMGVVEIHAQGLPENIQCFIQNIFDKKPGLSEPVIDSQQTVDLEQLSSFKILSSNENSSARISIPTDLFLCDDCLQEMTDPANRRYQYPFINCTQCGPRFTLIKHLPYDRKNTSMDDFKLCKACQAEYDDPSNRRFHAEPVACEDCGPSLSFKNPQLDIKNNNKASLQQAISALKNGDVIAVKGIGGYHLMCDATNPQAIKKLRDRKKRQHKPLAIMFPTPVDKPFEHIEKYISLNDKDKSFLLQPSRPILLLENISISKNKLPDIIAPGLKHIGIMLPYSPLHHLLLNAFKTPLIATSANISGEPVLTDNNSVENYLADVVDAYLHHNRNIERPTDDPVYKTIANKPRPIRLGRGIAPLELKLPYSIDKPVLAIGAHMKNTVCLAWDNRAVISPHIGEMHNVRSMQVFEDTISDLQNLYAVTAETIICDEHSGYTTSRWASKQNLPVNKIFHHYAHASAAYYECNTQQDIMVFTWDGTGYGEDNTLWGGETLLGKPGEWKRVASMRPFFLPGGDKAGTEPWRSAAALCWETNSETNNVFTKDLVTDNLFSDNLLRQAWQKKINSPQSSSVGRLFDAASVFCDLHNCVSYEGQGPMELEALCNKPQSHVVMPLNKQNGLYIVDWGPLLKAMLNTDISASDRSAIFHTSLAYNLLQQACIIREENNINTVSFSGGVFQNKLLTEYAINLLEADDFTVIFAEQIPVNDAGISFGQVIDYTYKR